MLKFIKYHWFGFIISILFGLFLIEFFLVMFAPHVDIQNRGFVPCTTNMATKVEVCHQRKLCILKAVYDNYICDGKVILIGLSDWVTGKQLRPWSNYMFEPEVQKEEMDEDLKEYYRDNPNIDEEMNELIKKHEELENINNEQ